MLTKDEALAARVEELVNHGQLRNGVDRDAWGTNGRTDSLGAALTLQRLKLAEFDQFLISQQAFFLLVEVWKYHIHFWQHLLKYLHQ